MILLILYQPSSYYATTTTTNNNNNKDTAAEKKKKNENDYCVVMLPTYTGYGKSQKVSISTYMGQVHRQCFQVPTYVYMDGNVILNKGGQLGYYEPGKQLMYDSLSLLKFIRALEHRDERMLEIVRNGESMLGDVCSWASVFCSTLYLTNTVHNASLRNSDDTEESEVDTNHEAIGYKVISGFRCSGCSIKGNLHMASHQIFLPYLQVLDLSHNELSGEFPGKIFTSMPLLRQLVLNDNELKGHLPMDSRIYRHGISVRKLVPLLSSDVITFLRLISFILYLA